jgi:hypothetical protein
MAAAHPVAFSLPKTRRPVMPDIIREAAAVGELTGNRQLITIATPGWGSSGYYSPEVLEQAAIDRVFSKGTQQHMDHDGEMARYEQPAGSVTRLAAALAEDARWEPDWVDPDNPEGLPGRLVAENTVFTPWRAFLKEAKDFIGASLSAGATVTKGEVDGRKGNIIEKLHPSPLNRVDYVTVAGRGGRISAVLESATRIVDEAVANDVEQWLQQAVRDAHRTDDRWVYLEGHDDTFVYFRDEGRIMRQAYTLDGVNVTLSGDPVEVRRRTEYDPVTKEAATPAAPQDSLPAPAKVTEKATSKETTNMAEIKIEETRLRTLEESHGRVPALEAKVDAAEKRATEAERRAAVAESTVRARDFATTIVTAANADLSESVVSRIVAQSTVDIPLTEALQLDTDALTETVNAAREAEETYLAKLAKENGLGQVRGIGATEATGGPTATDADIIAALNGGK